MSGLSSFALMRSYLKPKIRFVVVIFLPLNDVFSYRSSSPVPIPLTLGLSFPHYNKPILLLQQPSFPDNLLTWLRDSRVTPGWTTAVKSSRQISATQQTNYKVLLIWNDLFQIQKKVSDPTPIIFKIQRILRKCLKIYEGIESLTAFYLK